MAMCKGLHAHVQQGASNLSFAFFAIELLMDITLRFQLTFLCAHI